MLVLILTLMLHMTMNYGALVLVLVLILRCLTPILRLLGWVAFAPGSSHFHPACPFAQVN